MFDQNKKYNDLRPAGQKPKDKAGVVPNKNTATKPRDAKGSKQGATDMQSEGGRR